jgi:hypothetical protein
MRGIIIEKKWHSATVMTNNGQFRRLYFPFGKEVADEVFLQRQSRMQFAVAAMAVIILMAGLVGYNTRFQTTAYGFVSIEVNPAAEFQINKYGVVVDAVPLNGEAEAILAEISYRWRTIEKVAADYVAQALAAGLIEYPEQARILVTISGIDGADEARLAQRLEAIQSAQAARLVQMDVNAETDYRQVTPEIRQEAASLGVATGTWERLQQGEEITFSFFDLEIESGDDELEVYYRKLTHGFEAEVEREQDGREWEREGAAALEYLLPILRKIQLTPAMNREEIIQRITAAFDWPASVSEFSLEAVLIDGSRITIEGTGRLPAQPPAAVDDDDDWDDDDWDDDDWDDDDEWDDDDRGEQPPVQQLSQRAAGPAIVYFDLEIDGDDDEELDVEYERSTSGSVSADVEFELDDREILDLEGQAAVNYLLPLFREMNLQPGMSRRQVVDRVIAAFGWPGGYDEFEIEILFEDGSRISF